MDLYEHNKEAYDAVMNHFNSGHKKACVIQATGTGKSAIGGSVSINFKRAIVVAPNKFVLNQAAMWAKDIECATYSWLSIQEDMPTGHDFIWFDEMHRCGAERWGNGVIRLLEANKDAYVLGTTATEMRYLEQRDMAEEMFKGDIVHRLSLVDAWVKGILRVPKVVTGVVSMDNAYDDYKHKINGSKHLSDSDKMTATAMLDNIVRDWTKSNGVPSILRKYIDKDVKKMIIFAPTIEYMKKIKDIVPSWFEEAGIKVGYIGSVSNCEYAEYNQDVFEQFSKDRDGLNIILSVNMLNEGVHVPGVDAVMMLRSTISKNIFMQQIGRCFSVGQKHQPIILDLADNITTTSFYEGIYIARDRYYKESGVVSVEDKDGYSFEIIDTLKDTRELISMIDKTIALVTWDDIVSFINKNGRLPKRKDKEEARLYNYLHGYRSDFTKNKYPERIAFLVKYGFNPNKKEKYDFEKNVAEYVRQREENGFVDDALSQSIRVYAKSHPSEDVKRLLEENNIVFLDYNDRWYLIFDKAKAYYEEHGTLDGLNKEIRNFLFRHVRNGRNLNEEQKEDLRSIGAYDIVARTACTDEDNLQQLKAYLEENNTLPPSRDRLTIFFFRKKRENGPMWQRIVELGFDKYEDRIAVSYKILDEFFEKNGRLPEEGEKEYRLLVALKNKHKDLSKYGYVDDLFMSAFEELKQYITKNGCLPSSKDNSRLFEFYVRYRDSDDVTVAKKNMVADLCKNYNFKKVNDSIKCKIEEAEAYINENKSVPPKGHPLWKTIKIALYNENYKERMNAVLEPYADTSVFYWEPAAISMSLIRDFYKTNGRLPICKDSLYGKMKSLIDRFRVGELARYKEELETMGLTLRPKRTIKK